MTAQYWFGTRIRLVCLIEPQGATRYMDSVLLLRAIDDDAAFQRALALGRARE